MKIITRIAAAAMALSMLLSSAALADMTTIEGKLKTDITIASSYAENSVEDGISPLTGLPSSGEAYTPIMIVIDNAEDAYPHWGLLDSDIIVQIPNESGGATKLLAIFGDKYPEQAGGNRSGRASMAPIAAAFDAAFVYAGYATPESNVSNLNNVFINMKMKGKGKLFDALGNATWKERVKFVAEPHNLSIHVNELHNKLISDGAQFEVRAFAFADSIRTEGEDAYTIQILHYGSDPTNRSNPASAATYNYDEETDLYTRTSLAGLNVDRDSGEAITFSNIIVIRTQIMSDKGYIYLKNNLVGSGVAEIFQNGKYVQGAWSRSEALSRLVLIDSDGSELKLQPGRTMLVVTNDVTSVSYGME